MIEANDKLYKDFEAVRKIPIVETMLEVICRSTGMGFAAVARVTEDRWLACNVRDEIQFGLQPGGELQLETTICNEIRDSNKAVVIDHVAQNPNFCNHHTPKMYGFQSYISFPIILKNGTFFGTLCAIDPRPALLENPKTIGMFAMFSDLLSFHLQSIELMERSHMALHEASRELNYSKEENKQYQQISNHNLQEPLRKIRMFSDILANNTNTGDMVKAKKVAVKINSLAQELTKMIQEISAFSSIGDQETAFEKIDLNDVLMDVSYQLESRLKEKDIQLKYEELPVISAIPVQVTQLFSHLINNAITYSKNDGAAVISIYSKNIAAEDMPHPPEVSDAKKYCCIVIENSSHDTEYNRLDNVFDIFVHANNSGNTQTTERYVAGLASCRKIVHNHGGALTAESIPGKGVAFTIVLPVEE